MIALALRILFSRMGLYGLCGIAALAFLGWYSIHERNIGGADVITEINHQNGSAENAADEAERAVRACITSGRVWDNRSGQCQGG